MGLMAVGTALKKRGHFVTIHEEGEDTIPMDFEYYGLGPTTPEYPYALMARGKIKYHNPKAKVVIGGPFATLNHERCMRDGFDCVVSGDGELISEQAFDNGSAYLIAPERPLDEYPIVDRSLVNGHYRYMLCGKLATTMVTSRGCPNKCAFCCKNYKTVRLRSASNVIDEIARLHFFFKYDAVAFPDDNFILDRNRTEIISAYLRKLGMKWRCLVRADLAVKYGSKFIGMMAESGCVEVGIGIESGSDKILSAINKGETVKTIKEAVRISKAEGVRVKGFFIVGLPGESQDTIDDTKRFLDEMKLDDVDVKIFQPYPGSPIWDNKESYDIDWDDQDFGDMFYKGRPGEYFGSVRTSGLTNKQIVKSWVDLESNYKKCVI